MKRSVTVAAGLLGVSLATVAPAHAQLDPAPEPAPAPAAAPARSYRSSSGGGDARGVGVGVEAMFGGPVSGGPVGLSGAYDGGAWHADAVLGVSGNDDATAYGLGVRGWFHLHSTANADFSLGGGLGFTHWGKEDNTVHIEAGGLIRVFLTSNVAASTFFGLGIIPSNDHGKDGFKLGGQLLGGFGLHYFF